MEEVEEGEGGEEWEQNEDEIKTYENRLEMFQVPSDSSVNIPSRQNGSNPEVESLVSTPDWQQAFASTFQQDEDHEKLPRSVGDGKEESGDGAGGSVGSGEEVETAGVEIDEEVEKEGEETDHSLELLPVEPVLRVPKKRRRKTLDRRTQLTAKVISGQLQNSSHILPGGRPLSDPKYVPGELLFRRPGRKCGSFLCKFYRNATQSLPRTDQTFDWPLNCLSPEAPEPSWPEEEDQLGAIGARGTGEPRRENDDPAAAADRSPSRRPGNIKTWRQIEAKLGENDEELVLIIKGVPEFDPDTDTFIESSGPSSKRMRIIFVK